MILGNCPHLFVLLIKKINIIKAVLIAHVKSYSTSLLNKLDRLHIYVEPNFPTRSYMQITSMGDNLFVFGGVCGVQLN